MDLTDKINRNRLGWELEYQTNDEIKLDVLKTYLDAEEKYDDIRKNPTYHALKLKYKALTTVPTIIEKTMTPAQLYVSNSPLWALNYNADQIKQMINHLQNYPKSEEIFSIVLKEVSNGIALFNKIDTTI